MGERMKGGKEGTGGKRRKSFNKLTQSKGKHCFIYLAFYNVKAEGLQIRLKGRDFHPSCNVLYFYALHLFADFFPFYFPFPSPPLPSPLHLHLLLPRQRNPRLRTDIQFLRHTIYQPLIFNPLPALQQLDIRQRGVHGRR